MHAGEQLPLPTVLTVRELEVKPELPVDELTNADCVCGCAWAVHAPEDHAACNNKHECGCDGYCPNLHEVRHG